VGVGIGIGEVSTILSFVVDGLEPKNTSLGKASLIFNSKGFSSIFSIILIN